jgi:hypothetical protein
LATVTAACFDAVVLVVPVLLLERRASVLVGKGDRCWVKAVALVELVLPLGESIGARWKASVLVGEYGRCW